MTINPLSISKNLEKTYQNYLRTTVNIEDKQLAKLLDERLENTHLVKGPYLEATMNFEKGSSISDLIKEGILEPEFEYFIYDVFPYLKNNRLYYHQDQSIRKAINGRNLIITTGTGSGKTECFQIPILNHLIKESKARTLNPGVRALILYPLNALANDQIRRLREILNVIEDKIPSLKITFGRYIGDTKETRRKALNDYLNQEQVEKLPMGELISRDEMRKKPPHILITNYAMLEYLLLRPKDLPLFQSANSKSSWKFLVLDEAHSYTGAKGVEISLLLRRLKYKVFNGENHHLQAIATSATLTSDSNAQKDIIKFATALFEENFEWKEEDENRQDIIQAKFASKKSEGMGKLKIPLEICSEINKLRKKSENLEDIWNIIKKLLLENKIPIEFIDYAEKNGTDLCSNLYYIFVNDPRVDKIQELLKNAPIIVYDLFKKLNISEGDFELGYEYLELLSWLSPMENTVTLLPARLHHFVRSPEGIYVSLYPKKNLFLSPQVKYGDSIVLEAAFCKKCGATYLLGNLNHDKINQEGEFNKKPNYKAYFLPFNQTLDENEDEEIFTNYSGTNIKKKNIRKMIFCPKCGFITDSEEAIEKCPNCSIELISTLFIQTVDGDLHKCFRCNKTSRNIIRRFYFGKDVIPSVLIGELYQKISSNKNRSEKILSFSDSRQDAAFFASYLDLSYSRLREQRLIYQALLKNWEDDEDDYRLADLHSDLVKLMNDNNYFDKSLSKRQRLKLCWGLILKAFFPISARNSLEDCGLVEYEPIFPESLEINPILMRPPYNFTIEEIKLIFRYFFDNFRNYRAVEFPDNAPSPDDEIFSEFNKNREIAFILQAQKSLKNVCSFIPIKHSNSRTNFLKKILLKKNKGKEAEFDIKKILRLLWDDFVKNFENHGIQQYTTKKIGRVWKTQYNFWRVKLISNIEDLYICDSCRQIQSYSIMGVCSSFNCSGSLNSIKNISPYQKQRILSDHFYLLNKSENLAPLSVKEHTAQLETHYAKEIQENFIKGKINVLSCSTTFEMGVDLGSLNIIFLKNIPPEPANYIQRTGRAGRRAKTLGYSLSFALLRSHDLSYYSDPTLLISGRIQPPHVYLQNEKIIRRHLQAYILSEYFKKNPEKSSVIKNLFQIDKFSPEEILRDFERFLTQNCHDLVKALKKIIPKELHNEFKLVNNNWIEEFVSEDNTLALSLHKLNSEYQDLIDYENEQQEIIRENASNIKLVKEANRNQEWCIRRINTIMNRRVIDFLASNTVIPKYGFPVDSVELEVLNEDFRLRRVELSRNLSLALAEFAPGSQVVADKHIYQSYALKKIRNKEWERFYYAHCPNCGNYCVTPSSKNRPKEIKCNGCGNLIRSNIHTAIIPEFGFYTLKSKKIEKVGEVRPKQLYFSRPFVSSFDKINSKTKRFKIGLSEVELSYQKHGRMYVICQGDSGGFALCLKCGAGFNMNKDKTDHKTPFGDNCSSSILYKPFHLGYYYYTDVLRISIYDSLLQSYKFGDNAKSVWYSLLFSLIEGICRGLGIQRREINGTLLYQDDLIHLIIFDTVPAGAGHMERVFKEDNIKHVIESASNIISTCKCGLETSCTSCLRNYSNQHIHNMLKRQYPLEFFQKVEWNNLDPNKNLTSLENF